MHKNMSLNEVINIQQRVGDYMTTIKVDESVKRFEVEFEGKSTKVAKVVVELKENNQSMNEVKNE